MTAHGTSSSSVFKERFHAKHMLSGTPPSTAHHQPHVNAISSLGSFMLCVKVLANNPQVNISQPWQFTSTFSILSAVYYSQMRLSYPLCTELRLVLTTSTQLSYYHCFSSNQLSVSVLSVTLPSFGDSGHISTPAAELRSCFAPWMHIFNALQHELNRSPLLTNSPRKLCSVMKSFF